LIDRTFLKKIYIFFIIYVFFKPLSANETYEELFNKLERILPLEISFRQTDVIENTFVDGWMVLGGQGLVRAEFSPPNNTLIIGDGKWFIIHSPETKRTTYFPLNKGIFNALINPSYFKKRVDLKIQKVETKDLQTYILKPFEVQKYPEIRINFSNSNFKNIKSWEIKENKTSNILVEVLESKRPEKVIKTNTSFFKFNESYKDISKLYLGPFKRSINVFPSSGRSSN
tara:strand:- start:13355 stop:14038 length:684 start_codon:yes stop_codon:yes gene_type:complete